MKGVNVKINRAKVRQAIWNMLRERQDSPPLSNLPTYADSRDMVDLPSSKDPDQEIPKKYIVTSEALRLKFAIGSDEATQIKEKMINDQNNWKDTSKCNYRMFWRCRLHGFCSFSFTR